MKDAIFSFNERIRKFNECRPKPSCAHLQINSGNGEPDVTENLVCNKPIAWKQFKKLSDATKIFYVNDLLARYGKISGRCFALLFGANENTVRAEFAKLGIKKLEYTRHDCDRFLQNMNLERPVEKKKPRKKKAPATVPAATNTIAANVDVSIDIDINNDDDIKAVIEKIRRLNIDIESCKIVIAGRKEI